MALEIGPREEMVGPTTGTDDEKALKQQSSNTSNNSFDRVAKNLSRLQMGFQGMSELGAATYSRPCRNTVHLRPEKITNQSFSKYFKIKHPRNPRSRFNHQKLRPKIKGSQVMAEAPPPQ